MNQYNAITEEQKEQIKIYYFTKGYGQRSTARVCNCSRNTVKKISNSEPKEVWVKRWGQLE